MLQERFDLEWDILKRLIEWECVALPQILAWIDSVIVKILWQSVFVWQEVLIETV